MDHYVVWRLTFRSRHGRKAEQGLADALAALPGAAVVDGLKPHWREPWLWEVRLQTEFGPALAEGVLAVLQAADRLAPTWTVTGPTVRDGRLGHLSGYRGGNAAERLYFATFEVVERQPPVDGKLVGRLRTLWKDGPADAKENFVNGIARYVSKCASLDASADELRALGVFFKAADAVYLYERVRDISRRLEFEWREDFERYFPQAAGALPPVQVTREDHEKWAAEHPDETEFKGDDIPL